MLAWGAVLASGATTIADAIGLSDAVARADLVITGEGCFDAQSAAGKAPAVVRALAEDLGTPTALVAGAIAAPVDGFALAASLTVIATQTTGEPDDALRDPLRFARIAGGADRAGAGRLTGSAVPVRLSALTGGAARTAGAAR
ncbi:glycerate kinase [Curtobacterium sp. MCPF17_052]|uniref:glycerate kinase n=1 Tax=Curtobacterium sp. MCPF17_052 TaxID=2175655 RepID=UPI0024DF95C2|nr:glycerate kinase [Curtobacterium sp. MCPF17_052]WIB13948.1 glycerate kinase [Curtobacterium sp. MCPF17_052]